MILLAAAQLLVWDRLPSRVWPFDMGEVTFRRIPRVINLGIVEAIVASGWITMIRSMHRRRPRLPLTTVFPGYGMALGWQGAIVITGITGEPLPTLPWILAFWPMVIFFGLMYAARRLGERIEPMTAIPAPTEPVIRPVMNLGSSERVAFLVTAHTLPYTLAAILFMLVILAWMFPDGHSMIQPALVLSIVFLAMNWIQVTITEHEVRIGMGPWHWPAKRIPIADIADATVEMVDPAEIGRGYISRTGLRGFILHRGEALALRLSNGGRYIVTLPRARDAAGLINGVIARRRSAPH